jgi:hypothetical protein
MGALQTINIPPDVLAFLKRKREDDSRPVNEFAAPNIQALTRAQVPVDDSTPRIAPNPTYTSGQFSAPNVSRVGSADASIQPAPNVTMASGETRPHTISPLARVADAPATIAQPPFTPNTIQFSNQPNEFSAPDVTKPTMADRYMASAVPETPTRPIADAPMVASATRERRTQPRDMLKEATEATSVPTTPNYGWEKLRDAAGHVERDPETGQELKVARTEARHDKLGRLIAFGKTLGEGLLSGEGLPRSAMRAISDAKNPEQRAQRGAKLQDLRNQQDEGKQIQLANEQAKLGQIQANTQRALQPKKHISRNAQGQPIEITEDPTGGESTVRILDKTTKTVAPNTEWVDDRLKVWNPDTRRYDDALDTNGQPITSALKQAVDYTVDGETYTVTPTTALNARSMNEKFNITKKMEADRANNQYDIEAQNWDKGETDRVAKETEDYNRALADEEERARQLGELQKEQEENRKVADDSGTHQAQASDGKWYSYPNRTAQERAAARARANQISDDIGRLERQKKSPTKPRPAQPFKRPQLSAPAVSPGKVVPQGKSSGKFYTKAQVQSYADKAFNGDFNKAKANVEAEGFTVQ